MRKTWFAPAAFLLGALLTAGAVASFTIGDMQTGAISVAGAILAAVGGIYAIKQGTPTLSAKLTLPVVLAVIISTNLPNFLDKKSGSPMLGIVAAAAAGLVVGLVARSRPSGKEL
ncbi:hypothetical protein ADK86_11080 [Streptomyces sp. NRRL F-5755]|uniref:hypothetical protein n=1 Tax=Streptomyces sp. NRRL F-5755 TaxID=1519475 RepID=UPI0006AE7370|nr:hypothetical protein [Streptomyces sp. NRRL F-5755]KOU02255.1 hypothetical protein ADK86_11080 [Streptomyces sp. NRRL F-5755]